MLLTHVAYFSTHLLVSFCNSKMKRSNDTCNWVLRWMIAWKNQCHQCSIIYAVLFLYILDGRIANLLNCFSLLSPGSRLMLIRISVLTKISSCFNNIAGSTRNPVEDSFPFVILFYWYSLHEEVPCQMKKGLSLTLLHSWIPNSIKSHMC